MSAPDFHVEERERGSIFLRAVSDAGNQWILGNTGPWTLVAGGALVSGPHVVSILERIRGDELVAVRAYVVMRKPGF